MYAFINEVNGNKLNQTNEDIATRLECIEWVSLGGPLVVLEMKRLYGSSNKLYYMIKMYILACCRCRRKIQKKKEASRIQPI